MATVLLAMAGASIGSGFGGAILGMSMAAVGQAVGATVGRMIDSRLMSGGTQRVEGPRLDSLEIMASQEGSGMPTVEGRAQVAGQVIWATRLEEVKSTEKVGGKGGPSAEATSYTYFANFAVAICEGPVRAFGRVWANDILIDVSKYSIRLYRGGEAQSPDPLIVAKEGSAPAYRGIAYIVFDRFPLADFGNRLPQIKVEVWGDSGIMENLIRGVDLIPGSTEFGYMPTPVRKVARSSGGAKVGEATENCHRYADRADLMVSLDNLGGTLPNAETVALVVAWFGTDLRAGQCRIEPRVEIADKRTEPVEWSAAGLTRSAATVVSHVDGKPAFGSSPDDLSVIRAIQELRRRGKRVVMYPFIMMDIPGGTLPDPGGAGLQGAYPWRGRIRATAGQNVATEVAAFLGAASASHFATSGESVTYSGPSGDWGFRRFILHLAALAKAAGGVDAFLIGSEMVGLTQSTPGGGAYPFVDGLRALAAEVRSMLPGALISYAADWSEYHSHRPPGGDVWFNLDPLWTDPNVDFIGIDNYFPLADWRDGTDHLDYDAAAGRVSIYDLDYLKSNIEGGEYFDWYYASEADRGAQVRTPISDALGEPFIWRQKAVRDWHGSPHHNRIAGVRANLFASGSNPAGAGWGAIGGATRSPLGESFGGYASGALIASVGGANNAFRHTAQVTADMGRWYRFETLVKAGTSGKVRLQIERAGGAPVVTMTFGSAPVVTSAPAAYETRNLAAVDLGGVWRLSVEVRFLTATAGARLNVGPFSAVAGQDVALFCAEMFEVGVSTTGFVPGGKPVWFTEIGCPAVDKGANQPNLFPSVVSSEGGFPHYSAAIRDDFMPRQYLRAALEWWRDNGAGVVASSNILVWAWDARPWPEFPTQESIWADGPDWTLGHWLNGRAGNAPAAEGIARRLRRYHGLASAAFDVSRAYGQADGYAVSGAMAFRDYFSSWEIGLQIDAAERDGVLTFGSRRALILAGDLTEADFCEGDSGAPYTATRSAVEDVAREARILFSAGDLDYRKIAARASIEDGPEDGVAEAEIPLVLDVERAVAAAEAVVRQAGGSRETMAFALPPSRREVQPGRVVGIAVDGAPRRPYLIQRITQGEVLRVEAVSFAEGALAPVAAPRRQPPAAPIFGAGSVGLLLLDLPTLPQVAAGDHAGFAVAFANPWPGGAAVLRSADAGSGFVLNRTLSLPGRVGETVSPLPRGRLDVVSDEAFEVELYGVGLVSRPLLDVLGGQNALAVRHPGGWEILQFCNAELIGANRWRLSGLIRGQRGTECVIGAGALTAGASVVVLDRAVEPLDLAPGDLGRAFWYRFGPAAGDPAAFDLVSHTFEGIGRRPFAPCHLRAVPLADGLRLSWIRRTRIDGDRWPGASGDVPLGEAARIFRLEIGPLSGDPVRVEEVSGQSFDYSAAMRSADGLSGAFRVRVAQVSETFGPGAFATLTVPA